MDTSGKRFNITNRTSNSLEEEIAMSIVVTNLIPEEHMPERMILQCQQMKLSQLWELICTWHTRMMYTGNKTARNYRDEAFKIYQARGGKRTNFTMR